MQLPVPAADQKIQSLSAALALLPANRSINAIIAKSRLSISNVINS